MVRDGRNLRDNRVARERRPELPGDGAAFLFLVAGIWWATQPKAVDNDSTAADAGAAAEPAPTGSTPPPAPKLPPGHGGIPGH